MPDNLSNFNPLDTVEKSVSPKFIAAICISIAMHAIFLLVNNFNADSQTVSLPLQIVITQTHEAQNDKPTVIKPELTKITKPRLVESPKNIPSVKKQPLISVSKSSHIQRKLVPIKKNITATPPTFPVEPTIGKVTAHSEIKNAAAPAPSIILRKVSYFHNPAPKYPSRARRMGLEGDLLIRVRVLGNGIADELILQKSSGSSLLDNAALRAVRNWQFIPAQRNDKTISTWVEIPIRFKLDT